MVKAFVFENSTAVQISFCLQCGSSGSSPAVTYGKTNLDVTTQSDNQSERGLNLPNVGYRDSLLCFIRVPSERHIVTSPSTRAAEGFLY